MTRSIGVLALCLSSAVALAASPPRVVLHNTTPAGAFEVVVQAAVSLRSRLIVERQNADGGWTPVVLDLDSMRLVETCAQKVDACIPLEAGRTLRPVPWSGMSCSSQCNGTCDKNFPMSGTFRFVVKTCDGKERFEGAPFVLTSRR